MRLIIKFLLLIFASITFSSCLTGVPISTTTPKNNRTYMVQYLFEQDGCKVYRFYDNGHYVYFTNCNGDVTSIENDSVHTQINNHIKKK